MQTASPPSRTLRRAMVLATFCLLLGPGAARGQIEITLKNAFIEKYKNAVTIQASFTIDTAKPHPNPASQDGDLHIAGRAPEIGLPTVAEVMNAGSESPVVDLVHEREGTPTRVQMVGAWRIWCEHGGESKQVQGQKLSPIHSTNPPHVFEIHPLLQLDTFSVADAWHPIDGFTTKDAYQAFTTYEGKKSDIRVDPGGKTTTIVTSMAGYNYVEFKIVLLDEQRDVADGRLVMASVLDLNDELLVHRRRMVFAKGTAPEEAVRSLQPGDTLHVLGMPRIDLSLVSWRVRNRAQRPGVLQWSLPYEMVIVGVYH